MFCWTLHLNRGRNKGCHAAVAVGAKVYSFGGCSDVNKDQIDVHVLDTVSLHWRKLTPVTTGRGESPLWGHTAVLIEDIIYIWGGYNDADENCNILYGFDVNTHRWFKPKTSGNVPETSSFHSACVLGKVMYVLSTDMYKLDTTTMVWTLVRTIQYHPPISECHTVTVIGKKLFVFGGHAFYNNCISVFDTETHRWLNTPTTQNLPEKRSCHSAFAYNGELYIIGGCMNMNNNNTTLNDLWKFNLETFSWTKVKAKGKILCELNRMCCCIVGDRVIFFGGYDSTDDLYILDLRIPSSLKTICKLAVIQHDLDPSGLSHNIRWEVEAMTTNRFNEGVASGDYDVTYDVSMT